jgi:hypothetical protein
VPTANRPPPKPIPTVPARNSRTEPSGSAKITAEKAANPASAPSAARRQGVGAAAETVSGPCETRQRPCGHQRGERRGRRDGEIQDLRAVGLEQDVLHGEGRRADPHRDEKPARAAAAAELAPGFGEGRAGPVEGGARGSARLLLPERQDVEPHGGKRRALDDLDQAKLTEIFEQQAEEECARHGADEEHDVEQGDDARPRLRRGEVGGKREAGGLGGVQPGPGEEEGERRAGLPYPGRAGRVAGQDEQGERHDRQAAELQQRPEPDVGNATPAEERAVRV